MSFEDVSGAEIDPSKIKIKILNKYGSKKPKKRLSEKGTAPLNNTKKKDKDGPPQEEQDLQYQYGFSVEQQRER